MGYPFEKADPEGRFVPYHGAGLLDGEVVPYPKHPFAPAVMWASAEVFGEQVGYRLFGVGSVVGLAMVAWASRRAGRSRAAPWAFWIAAASPVLANGWLLWAHAPSAFVGGLLVLRLPAALVRLAVVGRRGIRRRRSWVCCCGPKGCFGLPRWGRC